MKQQRKALEEAHTTFAAADAEAARLRGRLDEITARMTQVKAARARQEIDLRNFATSGDPIDALAGKARTAARDAALARAEADAELDFLEAARQEATSAWHTARAKVAQAEVAIREAQYAESDAQVDALIEELWRAGKPILRKILDASHIASAVRPGNSLEVERLSAVCAFRQLGFVLEAFDNLAAGDGDFDRPLPNARELLPRSPQISDRERALVQPGMSVAQITAAISMPDPNAHEERAFDPAEAVNVIRNQEGVIAAAESHIASAARRLAAAGESIHARSRAPSIAGEIAEQKTVIERARSAIDVWRARLGKWRAEIGHTESEQVG